MTIENSEDTAQVGVIDPAEKSELERPSDLAESADATVRIEAVASAAIDTTRVATTHDSGPPMSRKLAPPPKPKRDSNMASKPPSAPPLRGDAPDLLASSSALKAPIAPTISYSADGTPTLDSAGVAPEVAVASGATAPLSQPPPIPKRRSNPGFATDGGDASLSARPPSDPTLGSAADSGSYKAISNAPRPIASPPRPRSEPPPPNPRSEPPAAAAPESAPVSSTPPSSSAIFAMRIIAIGDSVRPPPVQESIDPDSYPPSASRLGTSVRRSSRPAMAAVTTPEAVAAAVTTPEAVAAPVPAPSAVPADVMTSIDVDVPIDEEPPIAEARAQVPSIDVEVPPSEAPAPARPVSTPPVQMRPPPPPPPVELGDAAVSPDSGEKKLSAAEVEELGRDDAISMPPDEVAALQAELQAKADAVKPPPPPKRGASVPGSAPPAVEAAPPAATLRDTPPTPDPAAAKAAQRAKTRQPWWEDLFNEDFMRASAKVSEEHVRREVTFIEESLGVAAGGVVLDLGCGAGHHAVELASRGYGVVGYDLSLYQLALAADVAQERSQKINFLQGDMREMAFEEMFDGVFCWNTTFGYFEEDKNLAVAQRVFKALRPGGMFLIDVINRDFAAASAPCTVWYEGDSCVCMDDMSVDYISSRLRVKRSIILDDGRTKESLFSLRLYSLHELGKLLHEVGFRVTEASGHPSTPGVFFGPNSPRIIMLAQRP